MGPEIEHPHHLLKLFLILEPGPLKPAIWNPKSLTLSNFYGGYIPFYDQIIPGSIQMGYPEDPAPKVSLKSAPTCGAVSDNRDT
jgi:hypothetical protein